MRPWIVTGAAGHLGNLVVRQLLEAGRPVQAWVRAQRSSLAGLGCAIVEVDVRDPGAVARAVSSETEGVIHLAARISLEQRHGDEMLATNARGTEHVLAACRAVGARLVHVSSIHAYDPTPLDQPLDEDRPLATAAHHFAYDRSKALGEMAVRQAGDLDALIVNPTAMIGPEDHGPSEIGRFFHRLLTQSLPGLVAADFDWVDARDVAALLARVALQGPRRGRYVLSGERRALPAMARTICAMADVPAPRMISPVWLARLTAPFAVGWARLHGTPPLYTTASLATLGHYRHVDGGRARRELGWAPRALDETIADTVAWWKGRLV